MPRGEERASNLMTLLLVAVVAVPIAAPTWASLALWYIASCTTLVIVMINLLVGGFIGLVNGVVVSNFRHWFSLL
jgi:hypothetical protein